MSQFENLRRSIASELHSALASPRILSPDQATLYSQAVRIGWRAKGLPRWTSERANEQLKDAIRLLEAAHIASELGDKTQASDMYRRAGDILEWLSRTEMATTQPSNQIIPLSMITEKRGNLDEPSVAA